MLEKLFFFSTILRRKFLVKEFLVFEENMHRKSLAGLINENSKSQEILKYFWHISSIALCAKNFFPIVVLFKKWYKNG